MMTVGHHKLPLTFEHVSLESEVSRFLELSKSQLFFSYKQGPYREYFPLRGSMDDPYSISFLEYREKILAQGISYFIDNPYVRLHSKINNLSDLHPKELNLFLKELYSCEIRYQQAQDHANYEHFPYLRQMLAEQGLSSNVRVDLAMLSGYHRIPFHSHQIFFDKALELISPYEIIHIPVLNSEETEMVVRSPEGFTTQIYRPGEAWVFNSRYEHCVNNFGEKSRYNIMVYMADAGINL